MPASRKSSIAQIALQAPEIWNRFSAAEVVGEIFLGVSNEKQSLRRNCTGGAGNGAPCKATAPKLLTQLMKPTKAEPTFDRIAQIKAPDS